MKRLISEWNEFTKAPYFSRAISGPAGDSVGGHVIWYICLVPNNLMLEFMFSLVFLSLV